MKTLDLTHLYQNNVIYRSLIDNKLVFPSNIQEIHHRTRDKEISVLIDFESWCSWNREMQEFWLSAL